LSTRFADIGAYLTDRVGEFASARHITGRQPTDLRTVNIQFDAAAHAAHVALFEAGHGATVAGRRACVARVNT
jgi:exosome complex RNA-binding protein Rrp42 (RNase PH superfamily)